MQNQLNEKSTFLLSSFRPPFEWYHWQRRWWWIKWHLSSYKFIYDKAAAYQSKSFLIATLSLPNKSFLILRYSWVTSLSTGFIWKLLESMEVACWHVHHDINTFYTVMAYDKASFSPSACVYMWTIKASHIRDDYVGGKETAAELYTKSLVSHFFFSWDLLQHKIRR